MNPEAVESAKKKAAQARDALVGGALSFMNTVSQQRSAMTTVTPSSSTLVPDAKPAAATSASIADTPGDIPKDELMLLCMKMQKRMQAMEVKGQELVRKKTTLLDERKALLRSVQALIPTEQVVTPDDENNLDLEAIDGTIAKAEAVRMAKVTMLEQKLAELEISSRQPPPATTASATTTETAATAPLHAPVRTTLCWYRAYFVRFSVGPGSPFLVLVFTG